jgi:hypothetical protein
MSSVPSPGNDSHHSLSLLAICLFVWAVSCGPPQIRQKPLPRAGASPVDRPEVVLLVDGQTVLGNRPEGVEFVGVLTGAGYQGLRPPTEQDESVEETRQLWVLQLRSEDGATEYRLGFGLESRLAPALRRSQIYSVMLRVQHRGMFLPPALAVSIRDQAGTLLYLLDVDGAAVAMLLPKGLHLSSSKRPAFTTALTTASGCALTFLHHFLDVSAGNRSAALAPGEERYFRTDEGTYRVASLDISSSRDDVECVSEHPTYSAYVVERAEGDER